MITAFFLGLAAILTLLTGLWAYSLRHDDVSIVDRVWGLLFVAAMISYVVHIGEPTPRATFVLVLVTCWGVRLSWHIHRRNKGGGEDPRYVAMRQKHGSSFRWTSLIRVFWLQGLIAAVISWPLLVVATAEDTPVTAWDAAATLLFMVGFLFEAIGDHQLNRFKADPNNRGKVLDAGLWGWTRHPNYFGDALLWWGLWLFAAPLEGGVFAVLSPLLMTWLLRRVSGVTLLEKSLVAAKPDYAAYVARTPAFVPWPRRRRPR